MPKLDRRSFLKLAAATAPALLFPQLASSASKYRLQAETSKPNIIILLFDAMSARNLSLYGYQRPTSPNLERFAEHATVYHSHYAGGNYTIPGTASLLTGKYPWTHRAINYSGAIKRDLVSENLFSAFGADYYKLAFPQNIWSSFIVAQFEKDIDTILSSGSYAELNYLLNGYFPNDRNMATRGLDDFVFKTTIQPSSLLFGTLQHILFSREAAQLDHAGYHRSMPFNSNYPLYFRIEEVLDGLTTLFQEIQSPHISYIHLFPPHAPYRPTTRFDDIFMDGWQPIEKPTHRFSEGEPLHKINDTRRRYDEYVASLDWELGNLFEAFEQNGIFDDSYVIITADHGELFERGEIEHATSLLFDPVIHIPLLISSPGQKSRKDIYAPTNAVDLLPTLTNLANKSVPTWAEGQLLPELGGKEDYERATFAIEAKVNSAFAPLTKATIAMRKGNQKLIYYTGYEAEDSFELYDMVEDLEELNDLYPAQPAVAKKMKEELLDTLSDKNKPYLK